MQANTPTNKTNGRKLPYLNLDMIENANTSKNRSNDTIIKQPVLTTVNEPMSIPK